MAFKVNDEIRVKIELSDLKDCNLAGFEIEFDPEALEIIDGNSSITGIQCKITPGDLFPANSATDCIISSPGKLNYYAFLPRSIAPISQPIAGQKGHFATVHLKAKKAGSHIVRLVAGNNTGINTEGAGEMDQPLKIAIPQAVANVEEGSGGGGGNVTEASIYISVE